MFNFFMHRNNRFNRFNRFNRNMVYTLVSYDQIKSMILDSEYILIDVRTQSEYNFMHIINSVNIPVEKIRMCENEYRTKKGIIVYCSTGQRTKEAIKILNNLGYSNIFIWEYGSLTNFPYKDMLIM